VAVTAFVSSQDYEKCITSGMTAYIAKPVSKEGISGGCDIQACMPWGDISRY